MQQRIGNQIPTQYVVSDYEETKGNDAVEIYNKTGRVAQEWQVRLVCDIMAFNKDGLWTHTKYGYSLPRRNGKTEVVYIRELWGLLSGEKILHTAHRTTTSHSSWEKTCMLLAAAGYKEKEDYKTTKQFGLEKIEMLKGDKKGVINYRTRSSKGGLGEGFDLVVIDEAQEYTDDQDTALKYVVSDSLNPQIIYLGTPPTAVSAGTVFLKYRDKTLQGQNQDSGWAEWAVDEMTDQNEVEAWYLTNPSLGTILTERKIRAEIGPDEIDFNIQRLGLWIKYNQKSAITLTEWNAMMVSDFKESLLIGGIHVGVKFGHDGLNVAVSVAVKTKDDKVLIDGIDCRPIRAGVDWIVAWIKTVKAESITIDGDNGKALLVNALKDAKVRIKPVLPKTADIIALHTLFEQALESQSICHLGQPSMVQAATNCEKRAIGSNGGFGYKANKEGIEIALLESAILAHWSCRQSKEKKKRRAVSY